MTKRLTQIKEVLDDLHSLEDKAGEGYAYAVKQNIIFFESIKTIANYLYWLFRCAPKINADKLQEVNDLLPKYDSLMHIKLIDMEKKRFPGLIELLVQRLTHLISQEKKTVTVVNLGSGGMEAERQIINRLIKIGHKYPVIFIGVDQSTDARLVAKNNLNSLGSEVLLLEESQLSGATVDELRSKTLEKQYKIILCDNNIFLLDRDFPKKYFDFGFHTLFRHHLNEEQRKKLDVNLRSIANTTLEYDGFKDWLGILPQSVVGWQHPVFLNAEIFSNLRFATKSQIKCGASERGWLTTRLTFSKLGYYLLECRS